MSTVDFRLRHFDRDVGRQRTEALEYIHIHDRCIAGRHQYDHGFAYRAAEPYHDGGENPGARRQQHHPDDRLPWCCAERERSRGQMSRNTEYRVFADRKNRWNDSEPDRHPDHQRVTLIVSQTGVLGNPARQVTVEKNRFDRRADEK